MKRHTGSAPRPLLVLACLDLVIAVACAPPEARTTPTPDTASAAPDTATAGATPPPAATPAISPTPTEPEEPETFECELSPDGVKRVGPHAYEVERTFIVAKIDAPVTLQGSGDMAVPHYRDHAYAGIRFRAVRPGGVMRSLGLRGGDAIVSVNGQALDSPNRVLALYDALRRDTHLSLGVLRAGRTLTFTYEIR